MLSLAPSVSSDLVYLWEWYTEVRERAAPQASAAPLTYADFDAWQRFTRQRLEPWEFVALCAIDGAYLDVRYKRGKPVIDDGK